ncbi:MAG: hypothetical protein ACRCYP_04300, partial [Alphaproteobacteria bacterium]
GYFNEQVGKYTADTVNLLPLTNNYPSGFEQYIQISDLANITRFSSEFPKIQGYLNTKTSENESLYINASLYIEEVL